MSPSSSPKTTLEPPRAPSATFVALPRATSADCPACGRAPAEECLRIEDLPVCCNTLHATRDAALRADKATIALFFCSGCGHLFNAAFEEARVAYDAEYENSLHFSPTFEAFARELARDLVERHGLGGKAVVELACGKGDFLRLLMEAGAGSAVGYDPSYEPERGGPGDDRVRVMKEYFTAETAPVAADFVCCRHALEHMAAPRRFLAALRAVGEGGPRSLYFEVPDATYMLREHAIWDLIYEHCGYFTPSSLHRVFADAGFCIASVERAFEGQFLQIHARPGDASEGLPAPVDEALEADVRSFNAAFEEKRGRWVERLATARLAGQRVALWGAGSKGVTFLNATRAHEAVDCVVDVNPHKQGRFVPGTGHPVVSPEQLVRRRPDVIVVMNPAYAREIEQTVHGLGLRAEILVAR